MLYIHTALEEPVFRLEQYAMGSALTVELQIKLSSATTSMRILCSTAIPNPEAVNERIDADQIDRFGTSIE